MFFAHSTKNSDQSDWQPLDLHLRAVAELAAARGKKFGAASAAALAGCLHDLGKYDEAFQRYIQKQGPSVDHSTAGAAEVAKLGEGDDRIVAELIAYAIAGHHAGLPDKQGDSLSTLAERLRGLREGTLDPVWRLEVKPDTTKLLPRFEWRSDDKYRFAFQAAFLGRMIFSCLVDADFRDTEDFYARIEGRKVDREWPALQAILQNLQTAFDRYVGKIRNTETPVNRLRAEILDQVRSRAAETPGLFTLTVPTGGGKTLASLGFALDHARAHRRQRVIYAIPFTAIIDQTAAIFRNIFGEGVVLEHHSAIDDEKFDPRNPPSGRDKLKLAMEDWAAPIVVTTNVQLFESLFAARTSRSRKLHNIANSIIVLDEAQTIPRSLLAPCTQALDELARNYGCSIVLCTATQPALDARNFDAKHPAALTLAGRELAPDPERLSEQLERVVLTHGGGMDDAALVAALADVDQGLIIVNSRKHARSLYEAALQVGLEGVIHLSTRQYAAHRRRILDEVRRKLADKAPCRLIATSLVEAGVDLDFPRVWRAEAGLDQIAQAAGRCNREGARPTQESIVTIFRAPDNPPPPEIKGLSGDMGRVMRKHEKLFSPAAMADFFGEVYWRVGPKGLDAKAVLDDFRVGSGGTNFSYRTVAEKFRMIESGMAPVIIPGDERAREAVEKLGAEKIPSATLARDLQIYIVQTPPKARARLIACGHVRFFEERLRSDQFAVLTTDSLYRPEIGLAWEDAEYLALDDMIV